MLGFGWLEKQTKNSKYLGTTNWHAIRNPRQHEFLQTLSKGVNGGPSTSWLHGITQP